MQSDRTKYLVILLSLLLAFVSWILFRVERAAQFSSTKLAVNTNGDDRQPCLPLIKPSIDNIENYDWTYCTSDLGPFWASLNIPEKEFTNSSSVFEAASTFGDLDRDGTDERILRLTLGTSMIRFVILKRVSTGWRTLAHLDIPDFHLAPEARVASNGRASWLALNNDQRAWGSGILQENETWYELTNGRLMPAFSFPQEVDVDRAARPSYHHEAKAEASTVPFDGARDRLDVLCKAAFSWEGKDVPITIQQEVSFAKDPASQQFQFDSLNSDIPESTYQALCSLDDDDPNEEPLKSLLQHIAK